MLQNAFDKSKKDYTLEEKSKASEEHYFENTLDLLARDGIEGWIKRLDDTNRNLISQDSIQAIDTCSWYLFDTICYCKITKMRNLWNGNF